MHTLRCSSARTSIRWTCCPIDCGYIRGGARRPISLAANLHLAACVPTIRAIEYSFLFAPAWAAFGEGPELGPDAIVDGEIAIPRGPGLGVALNEAAVAKYPYQPPGTRVAGSLQGLPDRFVGDR